MITSRFFKRKSLPFRIHVEEYNASQMISSQLLDLLPKPALQDIVIVCIGTDRSTGDSLGPFIGSKLEKQMLHSFYVYGTLENPVHAVNLEKKLAFISEKHKNPFIIGIDACLGKSTSVGVISIAEGPVKPGAAVNKQLPEVGNAHITGIVNVAGFMEYMVLQNTRLYTVIKIADVIAEGIRLANQSYKRGTNFSLINKI